MSFLQEEVCDLCGKNCFPGEIEIKWTLTNLCEACKEKDCPLCKISHAQIEKREKHIQKLCLVIERNKKKREILEQKVTFLIHHINRLNTRNIKWEK